MFGRKPVEQKIEEANGIKIGDVVELKASSKAKMVVEYFLSGPGNSGVVAHCILSGEFDFLFRRQEIYAAALQPVKLTERKFNA
jgi:hypothetical protein